MSKSKGNVIRLLSGGYFDFNNMNYESFTLADIAGSLSKLCRFGGHIPYFYSVAEHSLLCSVEAKNLGCSEAVQFACLMHDATEAFIGDCVTPLKAMIPDFKALENTIQNLISAKFNIDFYDPIIDQIDKEMLIAERDLFFVHDGIPWEGEDKIRKIYPDIRGMLPEIAEANFFTLARGLYEHLKTKDS